MSENKTLLLGDTVYFEICAPTTDPEIMRGRLYKMEIVNPLDNTISGTIDMIQFDRTGHPFSGEMTIPIQFLYTSVVELCNAKIAQAEAEREEYRAEITDVTELVKFMFTHDMTNNDRNNAYYVAKEKATELLGITFSNNPAADTYPWFEHPDNPLSKESKHAEY